MKFFRIDTRPVEDIKRYAIYDYVMKSPFKGSSPRWDLRVPFVGGGSVKKHDDFIAVAWLDDMSHSEEKHFAKLNDAKRYVKDQLIRAHLALDND